MSNEEQKYSTPSYNPADTSEVGKLDFLEQKLFLRLEKIAPAEIVSYDRTLNRAEVKILNLSLYANGTKLSKKNIPDVPVYMMAGGGFVFSFPLKPGDKGWLITSDCDISVFKSLLQAFVPATLRRHKYESAFFLPDYIKALNISTDDAGAVILSSEDGTTKISINNGVITQTASSNIINGNLTVNGSINATGDVIGDNISLSTHIHSGVQSGSSNTGTPQ